MVAFSAATNAFSTMKICSFPRVPEIFSCLFFQRVVVVHVVGKHFHRSTSVKLCKYQAISKFWREVSVSETSNTPATAVI